MHGTDDATVITGASTAAADRDQCGAEHRRHPDCHRRGQPGAFVAQTDVAGSHGFGKFSIDAAGTGPTR